MKSVCRLEYIMYDDAGGRVRSDPERLNILLLLIDDLRADLGAYGRRWARTPSMDSFSAKSATFLQAHAAVANCAPSRASILTGLRPDTHGVLDLTTHVRARHPHLTTLPQHFREAGYLTVSYGKIFHQFLDDVQSWSPQAEFSDGHSYRGLRGKAWSRAGGWSRGWSYNAYVTPENRAIQAKVARRRRRGDTRVGINSELPRFEIGPRLEASLSSARSDRSSSKFLMSKDVQSSAESVYTDVRIADDGLAALARLRSQRRPWLLALGFIRPHLPFITPSNYWDAAEDAEGAVGVEATAAPGLSPLTRSHLSSGDGELFDFRGPRAVTASSAHGRQLARAYGAAVSFVDGQIGRVLDALDHAHSGGDGGDGGGGGGGCGGFNSTIVVLLSDHGFKLGHHGGWGKHTLTADDTHVPLMIHSPRFAPKRIHAPVELIDIYPTLCDLAGVPPPHATNGAAATSSTSNLPVARGRRLLSGRGAFAAQPPLEGRSLVPLMRRPTPTAFVAEAAAFSQWPYRRRGVHCMGYAVRTQGWLLVQWTLDWRDGTHDVAAGARRRQCEGLHTRNADLFRVHRNESREGVLREMLVPPLHKPRGHGQAAHLGHPAIVRRLRRRLRQAMPRSLQ